MDLRKLRERRGLTMQKLAEMSGLSVATIWMIENGKLSPTLRTMRKIAAALNMSVEQLLREAEGSGKAAVKGFN